MKEKKKKTTSVGDKSVPFSKWAYKVGQKREVTWFAMIQGRKEMFYLTTHSTYFIYGYMASDIWL